MTKCSYPRPADFFELRVHVIEKPLGFTAACAGYELNEWRSAQLSAHLIEFLPEFALRYAELTSLGGHNAVALVAKAARAVYSTPKYKKRGEIGELLLHVLCREVFDSVPAISKYYYKDSANNTVKGFDSVHVVIAGGKLELWLGESKFYTNVTKAINKAVEDLKAHTGRDYMRSEFVTIQNMIDPAWPYANELRKLLKPNVSLDKVFETICIPVLLTYDSETVKTHHDVTSQFIVAFTQEVNIHRQTFADKNPLRTTKLRVHLFLFPLKSKASLFAEFDARLKACQSIN
jgi:hypothetical protein